MRAKKSPNDKTESRFTKKLVSEEQYRLEELLNELAPKEFKCDLETLHCKDRETKRKLKENRAREAFSEQLLKGMTESLPQQISDTTEIILKLLAGFGVQGNGVMDNIGVVNEAILDLFKVSQSAFPRIAVDALIAWEMVNPGNQDRRRGEKIVKAAQRGNARTHGSKEERMARWEQIRNEYDALSARSPQLTKSRRYQIVAKKFRISDRTVRELVLHPKK